MYENIKILKGKRKGPTSIIIGGIHGNETCGVNAVKKIFSTLKIDAGKVIIAFGNPKAIIKKLRFVESNLNRLFRPSKQLSKKEKSSYEYSRMLFLKKYLKQSDFLLDIHASFTPKSRRFIICENNANKIIKYLPFNLVVNGFDAVQPGGTDYHMNKIGKIGICVECGYKDDPKSNFIAEKAIKANQKAYLKVDQYPFMEYGLITESIDNIKLEPTIENNSYYYIAEVKIGKQIKTNSNKTLQYMKGMSGIAEIVINKTPLIYKLIQPLQVLFNRN